MTNEWKGGEGMDRVILLRLSLVDSGGGRDDGTGVDRPTERY